MHRDIKPANIIILPGGRVKIADFGIARIEASSMTQAGTVLGTPPTCRPSSSWAKPSTAAPNLFVRRGALRVADRRAPVRGAATTTMHKALLTEPPPPSTVNVQARRCDGCGGTARAMAKRPEGRYPKRRGLRRGAARRDGARARAIAGAGEHDV